MNTTDVIVPIYCLSISTDIRVKLMCTAHKCVFLSSLRHICVHSVLSRGGVCVFVSLSDVIDTRPQRLWARVSDRGSRVARNHALIWSFSFGKNLNQLLNSFEG